MCMFLELMICVMFLCTCPLSLGLPPPSLTYHYEDKRGFLGEEVVIESPVLTGSITWLVLHPDMNDYNKTIYFDLRLIMLF